MVQEQSVPLIPHGLQLCGVAVEELPERDRALGVLVRKDMRDLRRVEVVSPGAKRVNVVIRLPLTQLALGQINF